MAKLKNNFYVCRDCGQTMNKETSPEECINCKSKDMGEIQIIWKTLD